MGRPFDFAPPSQATGAVPSGVTLPGPIELPTIPEAGGTQDLTAPTFPELTLPGASDGAATDLPDIPAAHLPDIFDA